ncbi:MAG: major facilitator superfamily domain-containing protein [Benniella sp.]|nr:MAG: major facilitator superfamily domain-containing protein [Benniella sp.]
MVEPLTQKLSSEESVELGGVDKLRLKLRPLLLYVVSTAQFIDIVNGVSVSVAILPIANELKFQVTQVVWIMNAYTIAFSGLLLFAGRLGDLFGHRRMFLFGLSWFALWALVVSFSVSPIMFVIARALQGVGAACTLPTAMALVATNYPPGPERAKAFSIFGAFGGMGAVAGILLAGGVVSSIGWTWIFRISAIAVLILLILGYLAIPSPAPAPAPAPVVSSSSSSSTVATATAKKDQVRPKVDFLGAITATMSVTGIVYYITTGVEYGWASAKSLPVFLIALVLLATFLWIETKVESPLMPLRIWKSRAFSASVVLAFVSMGMAQGTMYYVNMVFQEVYQWNALQTALGFLVHAILAIVTFAGLGRILHRLRPKPLVLIGFLLRCCTAIMFSFVDETVPYWRLPFPALILHITGVALTLLPIQLIAVRDAANGDQGLVGAIYQTGLQLGAPLGIALLNVVAISTNGNVNHGTTGGPALMKGFRNAYYGAIVMGVFGFLVALIALPWGRLSTGSEIKKEGGDATASQEVKGDDAKDLEAGAQGHLDSKDDGQESTETIY